MIRMVDSNIQRERVLPSEKAFAYKMKYEALKRKAGRPSKDNPRQVGANFRADEAIAENLSVILQTPHSQPQGSFCGKLQQVLFQVPERELPPRLLPEYRMLSQFPSPDRILL